MARIKYFQLRYMVHKTLLDRTVKQLPRELSRLAPQFDSAVGRVWLWKGIRAVLWDRPADACGHFARALEMHACVD